MKTNFITSALKLTIAVFIVMSIVTVSNTVQAAEVLIDTEIQQMTVEKDKNGEEYIRFIIQEDRSLNGIAYTADVVTMAFGSAVEKAKTLKEGDTLRAIASTNEYQGRLNYSILQIIE
jgi:cell division protein FtsL